MVISEEETDISSLQEEHGSYPFYSSDFRQIRLPGEWARIIFKGFQRKNRPRESAKKVHEVLDGYTGAVYDRQRDASAKIE